MEIDAFTIDNFHGDNLFLSNFYLCDIKVLLEMNWENSNGR